jgi:hypothetical protein
MQRLCYFISAVLLSILYIGTILCWHWAERLSPSSAQQPPAALSEKVAR